MPDWDARYRDCTSRLFGAEPNEYLRAAVSRPDVSPSSALCLGDGDGRNGLWLAEQEFDVTAVDVSRVATTLALDHDSAAGVRVERIVADLAVWQPAVGRTWGLAAMIYLQCEASVRHRAVTVAASALSPGGWFVLEGFSASGGENGLGPRKPDLLYELDGVKACLPGFRIVEAFDGAIRLDEGERHQGDAIVVRVLAQKPG